MNGACRTGRPACWIFFFQIVRTSAAWCSRACWVKRRLGNGWQLGGLSPVRPTPGFSAKIGLMMSCGGPSACQIEPPSKMGFGPAKFLGRNPRPTLITVADEYLRVPKTAAKIRMFPWNKDDVMSHSHFNCVLLSIYSRVFFWFVFLAFTVSCSLVCCFCLCVRVAHTPTKRIIPIPLNDPTRLRKRKKKASDRDLPPPRVSVADSMWHLQEGEDYVGLHTNQVSAASATHLARWKKKVQPVLRGLCAAP